MEQRPGERDWSTYDAIFDTAALQGIRVMPTLYGSPPFAARRGERPPTSRAGRRAFAQFVSDAAARYGTGGAFWQQFAARHPGSPALPPIYWQLWNEVNSPSFWLRKPTAKQYARLLKPTATAIRGQDPQAKIVLAGLFTRPHQKRAVPMPEYLNDLYAIPKIKRHFDAVAIHPYATTPADAIKTIRGARRILRSNKDGGTPIWITEMGWATSGTQTRFTTSTAGQAANLERSIGRMVAKSRRFRIAGVIWYSLRDSLAGSDWIFRTGLFEADGTPKPSWFSYLKFTGGTYEKEPQPGPGPGGGGGGGGGGEPPPCPLPPIIC